MTSPFAMYPPESLHFDKPNDVDKYIKYTEFAIYKIPKLLDKHSSVHLPNNTDFKRTAFLRKHKRTSSIILPTAGILMNACKNVSFSSSLMEKQYKLDK